MSKNSSNSTFIKSYKFFSETETGPKLLGNWEHTVLGLQYSVQDFYRALEIVIRNMQIPNIKIEYVTYPESGVFSPRRIYQRIIRKDIYFDICAAPLGINFFVSYRLFQKQGFLGNLFVKVPVIGDMVKGARTKTLYEEDIVKNLQKIVQECVLKTLNEITNPKGIRNQNRKT